MRHRLLAVAAGTALLALAPAAPALAASPGSLDSSFGPGHDGIVAAPAGVLLYGIAAEPSDGAVVVGTDNGNLFAERLDGAGNVLYTYDEPTGVLRGVAVEPDGDIVVAGTSNGAMLVQELSPSLSAKPLWSDSAFGGQSAQANAVGVTPSGGAVIAGYVGGTAPTAAAASFDSAGTVQWAKALPLGGNSTVDGLAVQSNGSIVLGGDEHPGQLQAAVLARLTSAGNLDSSFAGSGQLTYVYPKSGLTQFDAIAIQGNGQILAAGSAAEGPTTIVARLNSDGQFDTGFGQGGVTAAAAGYDVTEQNYAVGAYGVGIGGGGAVIAAGGYEYTGAESDQALWAFTAGGAADGSFGSGGTALGPTGEDEGCGMAVDPVTGNVITVGDVVSIPVTNPCGQGAGQPGPDTQGFISRVIGLGPPPAGSTTPTGAKPVADTGAVRAVGQSTATLGGAVDPEGLPTTYHFQYGTSPSYGSSTGAASVGAGTIGVTVSAGLSGLKAGTKYHYRLVATNSDGTSYGAEETFTTARASAKGLKVSLAKLPKTISDATLRANGLAVKVTCSQSCSFSVSLTVSKAAAEKARLGDRAVTLGAVKGSGKAGKVKRLTLRLSKAGSRYLASHTVGATVQVSASHERGRSVGTHRALTLKG